MIYRCGHCGNIVREDGSTLDEKEFKKKKKKLESSEDPEVKKVHGDCCKYEERRSSHLMSRNPPFR